MKNFTVQGVQLFFNEASGGNDSFAIGGQVASKFQLGHLWTMTPSYTILNWRNENVLLNEDGRIFFRGTQTIAITRDARWIGRNSFYVEHGDWFILACALMALLGYAALRLVGPVKVAKAAVANDELS